MSDILSSKAGIVSPEKDILYVLKAFAIISAVAAHCSGYTMPYAQRISGLLGTIGVPVFLLLSGFFFKKDGNNFWKKKWKTVVVPWLIWGVATYFIGVILENGELSLRAGVEWILGCSTWLYFVPVLLLCFALFRICSEKWWIYGMIGIWLLSNGLTITGVWGGIGPVTPYQNVLNWVGFFAIGVLLQKIRKKAPNISFGAKSSNYIIAAVLMSAIYVWWIEPSYWTILSIPVELAVGFLLLELSNRMKQNRLLLAIGKNTYPIFFAHMQFGVGISNKLLFNHVLARIGMLEYAVVIIRPIVVVVLTYGLIAAGRTLVRRAGFGQWLWILGIERSEQN